MKLFAKLLAAAALMVGINHAFAEDGVKTAVMDTGKGGIRLTISVPDIANGPYDFARNDGVGKLVTDGWNHQEVMFNAAISDTGVVIYQSRLDKVNPAKTPKRFDAEGLAQAEIEAAGFKGRAIKIDCPSAPIEGATIVCYKMSGNAIFEGAAQPWKIARVLAAISFANNTQAYMLMGSVNEKDIIKYNADPKLIEIRAGKALGQLFKGHSVQKN